jgi:hypothetical protein
MSSSSTVSEQAGIASVLTSGFFVDADFDFEARIALGATAYGVDDPGGVLATFARVQDGDRSSWFDAWTARGDELIELAEASLTSGDRLGAQWALLSGSAAYSRALGAVDGLPAEQCDAVRLPTFRKSRQAWDAMIDASQGRFLQVEVPYEGTTLPGYLLRPSAEGAARPTHVLTNGSDGSLGTLWGYGVAEALRRGWNAFVYDGPGQQSMLFERGVPFRPDWEAVLTPVVDTLMARKDVHPTQLTAYGISQAGYWLPRALAFEHRFVAAVADPGVVDVSTSWMRFLPAEMVQLLDSGQKDVFNKYMAEVGGDQDYASTFAFRARPYAIDDPFELFSTVRTYHLRDIAKQIRTPLFITDPQDEQFWPGQSDQLADLLTTDHEVMRFTVADGANWHCQPLALRLTGRAIFAWLQRHLDALST